MVSRIDAYQCGACGQRFFLEQSANKHARERPEAEPFGYNVDDIVWVDYRSSYGIDPFQVRVTRQGRIPANHKNIYGWDPVGEVPDTVKYFRRPFEATENSLSREKPTP